MDTLPVQHTDGAIELLGRGVKVYYLRRLTLLKKVRGELRLPKSARGDIKALMSIEERWFRRVTEDFLIMRRMILAHRSLMKTHQELLNKYKALSEAEKETLKPAITSIEKQLEEMIRMIAEEAGKRYPVYNRLVGLLGIDGNPSVLEALAEVLVLPEWASWRRTKNYFGVWRRYKKTYFHRSRTARQALERLTISLKGYNIRGKELKEVLKTIWINLKAQEAGLNAPA
jgi:predicted nucleotidyltransferase